MKADTNEIIINNKDLFISGIMALAGIDVPCDSTPSLFEKELVAPAFGCAVGKQSENKTGLSLI